MARKTVQISSDAHDCAVRLAAEHQPNLSIGQLISMLLFREEKRRGNTRSDGNDVRPVRAGSEVAGVESAADRDSDAGTGQLDD